MARRFLTLCLSFVMAGIAFPSLAQDGPPEDLYGRGVHAFFQRRHEDAHGLLTKAIGSGLKDPRAHYFLGLANLRLGRPDEAQTEFATGAELEAIAGETINIGRALERVQGKERLTIEEHRRAAREKFHSKAAAAAKARYEERLKAEERVLLKPRPGSAPATPAPADDSNPFKDSAAPAAVPAAPAEAKPATPAPAEEAKPAEPKPAAAEPAPATAPAPVAAEPRRGSVLGSLFRAVKKGAVPATGDNPPAGAAPAPPAAAPNPFDE